MSKPCVLENDHHGDTLIKLYINRIDQSGPLTISEETNVDGDWGARIGIKDSPTFYNDHRDHPVYSYVDDFKYYYGVLKVILTYFGHNSFFFLSFQNSRQMYSGGQGDGR